MVIPYARQSLDEDDIAAVSEVLRGPQIARGPTVTAFERALGEVIGAPYVVACSSGTAGLHLACLAAGIGPGDEAIVPTITFTATANAAAYCGATPVFADIDPLTALIDVQDIARKVTARTRAIIPVHFAGQSAEVAAIREIAERAEREFGHRVWVIEDACHVLGSTYRGTTVGSCAYSDMAVFSFHPVKHITTGEGGAVAARDPAIRGRLMLLRGHGITRDSAQFRQVTDGPWHYEQIALGYNYFLTDIQAALGIAQLRKWPQFAERRRAIMARYRDAFAALPHAQLIAEAPERTTNFHLAVLRVDFDRLGVTRAAFAAALRARGVGTQVHYAPVHLQPYYRERYGTLPGQCPNAEQYAQQCLTLPLFPAMTDAEVTRVIDAMTVAIRTYLTQATASRIHVSRS